MSRRALRERERAQAQATAEPLAPESPGFRVRDYSPEALGQQFSTTGPVTESPAQAAPPAPQAPVVDERTLTRRELRALREAAQQQAAPAAEPAAPEPDVPEYVAPEPAAPEFAAPEPLAPDFGRAEFVTPSPVFSEPVAPAPVVPPQPQVPQQWAQPQAVPEPQVQPEPHAAPSPPELVDPLEAPADWRQSAPQPFAPRPPVAEAPLPPVVEPQWARQPEPAPDVVVVEPERLMPPVPEFDLPSDAPVESLNRPTGHWSRQGDLDAQTQLDDIMPGRDLSRSDAITTSALVLPTMPDNPIGALSPTGEILVTGSIELPRMLGATGVHPARFDHSEVDSIIDASDREDSHPNSSPVRAIRAVSTHTSTQGIIAAKRPRSKLPTYILAGVATVMGAGVVVLFVGGMLLDLF